MSVAVGFRAPRPPSLARYLLLGLLIPVALIALGRWLDGEYDRMRQTGQLVEQITVRRAHALDLLASLRKAETAQRGFIITRDAGFLKSYDPSRREIEQDLVALARSGAARDGHLRLLDKLVMAKFSEMDEAMRRLRLQGQTAAIARVTDGEGQRLMNRIEAELQAIIIADAARVSRGTEAFWSRTERSRRVVWLLVTLIGGLALASTVAIWIARRERWRVMVAEVDASARNQATLDSTSDAIVILNPSGTIESVNAAARRVLGYEPEELSRRDISVVLDIAEGDGCFHNRIGLSEGRLQTTLFLDRSARTKDGRMIPVDVALGLMEVPDGIHVVASIRDISHRREIERIKDDFIATVSHELRTPLTSVVGSLGLLRGGAAGELPQTANQLVDIAENNARRLIRLTNDILDLEKFGSGQLAIDLAATDLVGILRQAALESEVPAHAKGIRLSLQIAQESCAILADRQRLLQVAANLLSNAVRHSPKGSTVTIGLTVETGVSTVRISDEGPGVPEAYRAHIFDRFVQAPADGQAGGTGLGLAIAREIVLRHGGAIWVEAAPGGGACFAFTLACHDDDATLSDATSQLVRGSPTPPLPLCEHSACPTILMIDDDEDLFKVVAASLAGEARVVRANGIASAQAVLEWEAPALVLLDIGLPDGAGTSLLPSLVGRDGQPVPTIIFSAQDSGVDISGPVKAVLVKSRSSLPMLRDCIREILSRGELR